MNKLLPKFSDAVFAEMGRYETALKIHLQAMTDDNVSDEVFKIHQMAVTEIFMDCPMLLEYLLYCAENDNVKVPEAFTSPKFRERLLDESLNQMERILKQLIKGVK